MLVCCWAPPFSVWSCWLAWHSIEVEAGPGPGPPVSHPIPSILLLHPRPRWPSKSRQTLSAAGSGAVVALGLTFVLAGCLSGPPRPHGVTCGVLPPSLGTGQCGHSLASSGAGPYRRTADPRGATLCALGSSWGSPTGDGLLRSSWRERRALSRLWAWTRQSCGPGAQTPAVPQPTLLPDLLQPCSSVPEMGLVMLCASWGCLKGLGSELSRWPLFTHQAAMGVAWAGQQLWGGSMAPSVSASRGCSHHL